MYIYIYSYIYERRSGPKRHALTTYALPTWSQAAAALTLLLQLLRSALHSHSLTHMYSHSLTHMYSHSLTHMHSHSLTHMYSHSLTHTQMCRAERGIHSGVVWSVEDPATSCL